jgi:cold shock CspA family protein
VATGKILRFDEIRGYGFIAPDSGGEDVFLHANALLAEKHQYHPGVPVEFDVIEGERGLKATAVRVVRGRAAPAPMPAPTPTMGVKPAAVPSPAMQAPAIHGPAAQPQPAAVPSPAAQPHSSGANGSASPASTVTATPPVVTPATVAAQSGHVVAPVSSVSSPAIAQQRSANGAERPGREAVTPDALGTELVELCLESVPSMTGEQIIQLRRAVVTLARRHGWVNE